MSSLQLVLIIAGVLLVVGVIVYNQWQERRLKGRTAPSAPPEPRSSRVAERVEPTLSTTAPLPAAEGTPAFRGDTTVSEFEAPVDVIAPPIETAATLVDETPASMAAATSAAPLAPSKGQAARASSMPDHEIECLIPLQPAAPVTVAALGAGLGARIGKPVRWFGRVDARSDWQRLDAETQGAFAEIVACLLLADRNGAASRAQLDTFIRVVGDVAHTLPAAFTPPEVAQELARAEALDRLCAELDVQIGLTVQKPDPGSIAGTRLRGVAEAAGFRLAPGGRFEYAHEDTGAVLYTLQNLRPDPFTAESLRLTATNGVVFLLDVARTADPVRTFDQMKLAAKRLAKTLGAELVDDNHRPLDDAAFTVIREQVDGAVEALRAVHIEPGSARALALFSA
ncbi:MAG TPA: cell division protein ZipA C-terminal FtsZ-binding domain-containing protein [Casimicrobiaceae bacterium]|nr:cell division protein ZipA C-terminal FtsZ-binding domain-containing protein [Casimicrobiaceae bacterium]